MTKEEAVLQTAQLLAEHFANSIERRESGLSTGLNSKIFSHLLHREEDFVTVGQSKAVKNGAVSHPEHVVPCSLIMWESIRLLEEGKSKQEVAKLIAKHWKIVNISKEEARYLDTKEGLNLQIKMPDEWSFENGDSFERLKLANIEVIPLVQN